MEDDPLWNEKLEASGRQIIGSRCSGLHQLLEKIRAFEAVRFEDGGDYVDGRELAWLGSIKADIVSLKRGTE